MDPNSQKTSRWVTARLDSLEPSASWVPDAAGALARLRQLERAGRARRMRWLLATSATAAVAAICIVVVASPQACATPRACAQSFWHTIHPRAAVAEVAAPVPVPEPTPAVAVAVPEYKQFGPAMAAVVCEIYSDYECPACAMLHRDTVPLLMEQYVKTGRIRLVFRDFPLDMHRYSRLAARYANAAGRLGYYQAAADRIFATQASWAESGKVDAELASVLPRDVMEKVRQMVAADPRLDDSIEADLAAGRRDKLNQTPTLVIVHAGKRQALPGVPPFQILKSYLDGLLAR